jgi:hypothetical protein
MENNHTIFSSVGIDEPVISFLVSLLDSLSKSERTDCNFLISTIGPFLEDYPLSDVDLVCRKLSCNFHANDDSVFDDTEKSRDWENPQMLSSKVVLRESIGLKSRQATYGSSLENAEDIFTFIEYAVQLAVEKELSDSKDSFVQFVLEIMQPHRDGCVSVLKEMTTIESYVEDLWYQRYDSSSSPGSVCSLKSICLICSRMISLTSHHLYPRELHKKLLKKGLSKDELSRTVSTVLCIVQTSHAYIILLKL